ncbi:MAG: hypothetical protein KTR33_13195 [Gammaproteobacteria bacterium]|nr:hypothetical protein [Gammaproteobacteria bacterium]
MRAGELQSAAQTIANVLQESDVLSVIRECRAARGDQWSGVAGSLLTTGSGLCAAFSSLNESGATVLRATHLDKLATNEYWAALASTDTEEADRQAELVRLYSRVMFASNHLPMLAGLIDTDSDPVNLPAASNAVATPVASVPADQSSLLVKLMDAGERASDPDRIARAIDGVDMLYSACASLGRKTDSELALLSVSGSEDRDILFAGDPEIVQSLKQVIESIPVALEELDPNEEIDLQQLIRSLPVFDEIATLKNLGTYSEQDLGDISESMHQGVLLSLESGLALVADSSANTSDDAYYSEYLRERERLAEGDAG